MNGLLNKQTELKIVNNTGTDKEKRYAKTIIPVRQHGNFLLCRYIELLNKAIQQMSEKNSQP